MLIGIYSAILLAGVLFILARRDLTVIRGQAFFALTTGFAALAVIDGLARASLTFWATSLLISLFGSRKWFLVKNDPGRIAAAVESSLKMLLVRSVRIKNGYSLPLGERPAVISLFSICSCCSILSFRGERDHQKVRLLRALLAKKFRPVFPRPTIDLR